jgi:hypothetical protein
MSSSSAVPNLIQGYNPKKTKFYDYDTYTRNQKELLTQQYLFQKSIRSPGKKPVSILNIQNIQPDGELINDNNTQGSNSPLD